MVKDRGLRKVARKMPALLDALDKLKEGTVLEVGCGFGNCLREIARRHRGLSVIGMNRRPHAGQPKNMGFNVIYGDAGVKIPMADCTVDLIYSNCMLSFVADKMGYFKEAFRVLKAGGTLMIRLPSKSNMLFGEVLLPRGTFLHKCVRVRGRSGTRPSISLRHFLRYVASRFFSVEKVLQTQVVAIRKSTADIGRDFVFPMRLRSHRSAPVNAPFHRYGVFSTYVYHGKALEENEFKRC